jgi:hypothetical protein
VSGFTWKILVHKPWKVPSTRKRDGFACAATIVVETNARSITTRIVLLSI